MRHSLAISAVALAIATIATPGEAQTFNRNGGGQQQRNFGSVPQNGGFSQRSVQAPSNPSGNFGNRTFRSVQPPAPGGNQASNVGNNRRTLSVQPPAPGGNQAGNQAGNAGNNARSFSIQPPPAGGATRSAQPPIGNTIQPPIASPTIPTATATAATVGAVAATAAVATSARAQQGPVNSDTAQVGQPIDPAAAPANVADASATAPVGQPIDPAANSNLPPLEMLASVGEPIMPLAQAPAAPVANAGQVAHRGEARLARTVVAVETCNVPVHHVTYYHRGYRRW
jgi:hypothetical protein